MDGDVHVRVHHKCDHFNEMMTIKLFENLIAEY